MHRGNADLNHYGLHEPERNRRCDMPYELHLELGSMIRNHAPSVGHQRNLKAVEINFEKMTRNITILKSLVSPNQAIHGYQSIIRHYGLQNLLTLSKAYIPKSEKDQAHKTFRSPQGSSSKPWRPLAKTNLLGQGKIREDSTATRRDQLNTERHRIYSRINTKADKHISNYTF